jgi:hypothetical protein
MEQWGRSREIEALAVSDPQDPQQSEILVVRDALGDDRGADSLREADE